MAASASPLPPVETSADDVSILAQKQLEVIAADGRLTMQLVTSLWDCLTHCAEPKLYDATTEKLQGALDHETAKTSPATSQVPSQISSQPPSAKEDEWYNLGLYQIERDVDGTPIPDPDWPATFQFVKGLTPAGEPYFQLFKSEVEAWLIDTTDPTRTDLAIPQLREASHYVYRFNKRYVFGPSACDATGELIDERYYPLLTFNYAEHALMGNKVNLKYSSSETFRARDRPLDLTNKLSLTYGEISALGGDFFGTLVPIMRGKNFSEQCNLFRKAYATLAEAKDGATEANKIHDIMKPEMDHIGKVTNDGNSTADTLAEYRRLKQSDKALPDEDRSLNEATHRDGRPSYLALAQLNLDHFGQDAVTAYNAGHYCAMQEAKGSSGDISTAYAMNAFADHFLGDFFSAGHFRTPRQVLHGDDSNVQNAIDMIVNIASSSSKLEMAAKVALEILNPFSSLTLTLNRLAPDLCAKYMHDEDNILGLWVNNKRGDQWLMFGDSKLFAPENVINAKFMQEALQVSADEIFTVFENKPKEVPLPGDGYGAWNIAPAASIDQRNHRPLFDSKGQRRSPWDDRKATGSDRWWPGCYSKWAIEFIQDKSYFPNLK